MPIGCKRFPHNMEIPRFDMSDINCHFKPWNKKNGVRPKKKNHDNPSFYPTIFRSQTLW